ncbi:MAG: glycoside hydrolase family 172 protein [Bacteroidales bacterium]|jgi:hypothetical protein
MKSFNYLILLSIFLIQPWAGKSQTVTVSSLLSEMADLKSLAERPSPWYKQSQASSYDRKSHDGGESWFANGDVGQYVRTEFNEGRKEQVLADLTGPGCVIRFWSANPDLTGAVRFYFDGEAQARLNIPLNQLFSGKNRLFPTEFSYISGTGGNLYFPIPYGKSLKITIEDPSGSLRLYYEIGYRSYDQGTAVETMDPSKADFWASSRISAGLALTRPEGMIPSQGSAWSVVSLTVPPGESRSIPEIRGEKAVFRFSAKVENTEESAIWTDPKRAHVALRHLLLNISFDGETGVRSPLGDFFGSGPGINPYENLFFTVGQTGWMTSRLVMPFKKSMRTEIFNAGTIDYTVELVIGTCSYDFTPNSYYLHAQWGTLTRDSWPPFDINFLDSKGEGKVIGTVYEVTNPSYIWWGEGDQKISIDGETFPSSFGTGTEDDYGFAYGYNGLFTKPYHAQTRVDGPASGGHISLNRWYVLDALPYRNSICFDQEIWHWMPCKAVWSHIIYWYAKPGSPGPVPIDTNTLIPLDLGIRENMLELIEGEAVTFEASAGTAKNERLANCSGARHLVWRNANPGDSILVHFNVPVQGEYQIMVNLCMSPDNGNYHFRINGTPSDQAIDAWSAGLYWIRPVLGRFHLKEGDNILEVELAAANPRAKPGNLLGLDYIFLTRMN